VGWLLCIALFGEVAREVDILITPSMRWNMTVSPMLCYSIIFGFLIYVLVVAVPSVVPLNSSWIPPTVLPIGRWGNMAVRSPPLRAIRNWFVSFVDRSGPQRCNDV